LKKGIAEGVGNALLVKLNQIGTVTETPMPWQWRAMPITRASFTPIGRDGRRHHRRSRCRDQRRPNQDRLGKPNRRVAKYNQLLRIEEALGSSGAYAGRHAIRQLASRS
jgi:enolase